jgi:sortase B
VGGEMIWPVSGSHRRIIADFGPRSNPITRQEDFYHGIGIAAPAGSNIYAANDGMVIISEWNGTYGNFMVIYHGGGITTLYGHAESLLKKVGDRVEKGEIIAAVGSTGWSTGLHLRFEIAENGVPRVPINALDNEKCIINILQFTESINIQREREKSIMIAQLENHIDNMYGWIRIPGTNVDYPVVQGEDNMYYLQNNIFGAPQFSGAIYVDYRNDKNVDNNLNTVIYGHNMSNGTMFSSLLRLAQTQELFDNGQIELITPDGTYIYEIFSAHITDQRCFITEKSFQNGKEYVEWLYEMKSLSIFPNDRVEFTPDSRIITLSTCTNAFDNPRFAVHGVLVEVLR